VGLALLGRPAIAAAPETGQPNILFIYADDLGLGDVSCYNADAAWRTRQFDRLGAEGMRFTDAHSASALCTPSRYALVTGRSTPGAVAPAAASVDWPELSWRADFGR